MPATGQDPLLYEVNARVWLNELAEDLGRPTTLDDIPDAALDRIAGLGFKWVWFLGVWRTGERGPQISRGRADWRQEFQRVLPDLRESDICGSCFAIADTYSVHPSLGGTAALGRLRRRLRARDLRLMLDFVPNHTALDHPWVTLNPDYYIHGTEALLAEQPHNYVQVDTSRGRRILAYGRDPYFPGWIDTAQLNYADPGLQAAMRKQLVTIAALCDGVRCDMAMLILPEVFEKTWSRAIEPFWPAAIERVRRSHPDFVLMAEVYWNLEWPLQQQGFNYCYDKRLYDRLRGQNADGVHDHLRLADAGFQRRLARFLENHDEPRAADAFPRSVHEAAAILTYLSPGLRFFHQGQLEGRRVHIPMHLCRAPLEPFDPTLRTFYSRLLRVLREPLARSGTWRMLAAVGDGEPDAPPARAVQARFVSTDDGDGDTMTLTASGDVDVVTRDAKPSDAVDDADTNRDDDADADADDGLFQGIIAFSWSSRDGHLLVVVNYTSEEGRCRVRLPFPELQGRRLTLVDHFSDTVNAVDSGNYVGHGLFFELPPWGYRVVEIRSK
jgi:hypothetical protein